VLTDGAKHDALGQGRGKISITAETVVHQACRPICVWFKGLWWIDTRKNGDAVMGLLRVLRLQNEQANWGLCHKLRRDVVHPGRTELAGEVGVDDSYFSGLEEGVDRRKTEFQEPLAITNELDTAEVRHIRSRHVPKTLILLRLVRTNAGQAYMSPAG
jgi:hypothetical protein